MLKLAMWIRVIFGTTLLITLVSLFFIIQGSESDVGPPQFELALTVSTFVESTSTQPIPKFSYKKGVEINLTENEITLWQDDVVVDVIPISYQAKVGRWFQTPTGRFSVGEKSNPKISSFTNVVMPYSIQFYEDFFIHQIPFFPNGEAVTSAYSGGCIRLEEVYAKKLYEFVDKGTQVVSYRTFGETKSEFHSPVKPSEFYISRSFNNPFRQFHDHAGDIDKIPFDYYQHTGIDFAPNPNTSDLSVYSIASGTVVGVWNNGNEEHGFGNTLMIKYGEFFALYGHLDSFSRVFEVGEFVGLGEVLGTVGSTGYGCNYWKIGEDGCGSDNPPDNHLHLEIKTSPTLENPIRGGACQTKERNPSPCWGYTPDNPTKYGYINPFDLL